MLAAAAAADAIRRHGDPPTRPPTPAVAPLPVSHDSDEDEDAGAGKSSKSKAPTPRRTATVASVASVASSVRRQRSGSAARTRKPVERLASGGR